MRTLGPEEQVVSMHQLANKDEKGNHWIIEIPVGIESTNGRLLPSNPDCFFFPSYWIQRLDAGTCMVVAMYRYVALAANMR